jgi:DNA-binding PadR family transcriptional regulator
MLDIERHQDFLPLPPMAHVVMVALADANMNCIEIVEEIGRDSDGIIKPPATRVMETIRKLKARDLVEDSPLQPEPDNNDDLRRFYALTMLGMKVAAAETQRIARLIYAACDKKLVTRAQVNTEGPSVSGSHRL